MYDSKAALSWYMKWFFIKYQTLENIRSFNLRTGWKHQNWLLKMWVHSSWYSYSLGDGYLLYLVRTGTKPSMEFWLCPQQYSLHAAPQGWNETRMKGHSARAGSDQPVPRWWSQKEQEEWDGSGGCRTHLLSQSPKYIPCFSLSCGFLCHKDHCYLPGLLPGEVTHSIGQSCSLLHVSLTWQAFEPSS